MAMGARPIAVMDQLRFGAADAPDTAGCSTAWCAVSGVTVTPLGLPNIGGETVFDSLMRAIH